jgi:hypothetical protein
MARARHNNCRCVRVRVYVFVGFVVSQRAIDFDRWSFWCLSQSPKDPSTPSAHTGLKHSQNYLPALNTKTETDSISLGRFISNSSTEVSPHKIEPVLVLDVEVM